MSESRDGCCSRWPKPCPYHEGWTDGAEAFEQEAGRAVRGLFDKSITMLNGSAERSHALAAILRALWPAVKHGIGVHDDTEAIDELADGIIDDTLAALLREVLGDG